MLNKALYYLVLIPLSKIPLWLSYIFFKPVFWFIYYVIGYRKKVVSENLLNSFPKKTDKELSRITRKFYLFLTDLLVESLKNLNISKTELLKRITINNPELMDELYDNKKSVVLMSSHINNWEFLITAQNLLFKHQAIGIGTPLSNSYLNKKINAKRARFGMNIVSNENYKNVIKQYKNQPTCTLVLGDQSPSNINNVYWTPFLNRETPFFFGAEIMANQMDAAVVYASISKIKRGYYSIELKLISDKPLQENYGEITSKYVNYLEKDILQTPSFWLWSHKRWKIKIPKNISNLKSDHKLRFNKKFRT